jgi:hypothetical protein
MNEVRSEGWIDRHGRILAEEALKTYRNAEDALVAIQRPGELQWLWGHTDNPRMPSHIEDGPLTPILLVNIKMRLKAEGLVQVPPPLGTSSVHTNGAKARLEEIAALTLSWWCLDAGEQAERCSAFMNRVQALAATGSGS